MEIFVFGSNLNGHHSGGSAAAAYKDHGAVWGVGVGMNGKSYAIPTLGHDMEKLQLYDIEAHVREFINFAFTNHHVTFNIVAIGCGIAGFTPEQIAPMFKEAPLNCFLPPEFIEVLNRSAA